MKFAASICVKRITYKDTKARVETRHGCVVFLAANAFEAEGIALAMCRKLYPSADGWECHDVTIQDAEQVMTLETVQLKSTKP